MLGQIFDLTRVVYKNRALPITWLVAQGSKGHFSEEDHITLIQQIEAIIPEGTDVTFLGDGEFDGIDLQTEMESVGFQYVCRTAKDTILNQDDNSETFEDLHLWPGGRIALSNVTITRSQYGPVQAIAWWDEQYDEPIYLISNLTVERQLHFACQSLREKVYGSDSAGYR